MPSGYDLDSRSRTAASGEPSAAAVPVAVLIGLLCLAATVPVDRALAREAATTAGDQGYVWPLDVVPELTSTFGEFRDGHFHAGIDLSTFGRQGVPVRAVADGMVVRVRAAPNGYGRAIYLELDDGRLAVYAHLSRYMPELAEYVATQQERRRSYRVDLYPERSRFPVHRGQVIGWSGASGAGGPHLHFELREGDVAINPLVHGLPPHDVHAPTLRALVLTPLDEQARIDGACAKQRLPLHWTPDGYVLADATVPHLWGRIAVGVDCYDRAGERASRLAPLEATLELDGELLVTTRFERVSYDHAREVFAEFDLEEVLAGRKHVLSLQATPRTAGTLHGDWPPGSGRLDLQWEAYRDERGPEHQLVVRVSDAAGHVSELEVPVRVVPPIELVAASLFVPSPQSTAGGPASKPKLHVRWHDWSGPGQPTHVVIEGGELSGSFEALLEQPLPEIPPTSDRGARATFDLSELLGPRAGWPAALRVCLRSAATGLRSNRRVVALDPDGAGAIDGIGGQLEAVVDRADDTTSD
ncbi:MAG: M23 family metallopeptidase, partial [Candidatus Eiseniibacteriota bacterium]